MSEKLRMAVVGVGYMGEYHAACIKQAENTELVAVIDPNETTGRAVAEAFGCAYIKDASELKDHPEIDAVNICVPEEYHVAAAEACAACGKHIAIEKPLAKTAAEAQKIIDVCRKYQVRLLVEHTVHFVDDYRFMKSDYEQGRVGNVSQITITRHLQREDMDRFKGRVSILYYVAVHDLEAVQWITGHKIVKVASRRVNTMNVFGEEGFTILFELDNGACGTMNVGWQLPNNIRFGMDRIVIVGDKGYMDYDQGRNPIYTDGDGGFNSIMTGFMPIDGELTGPYLRENVHFADAVLHDKEFWMNTEDAVYILKVIEAILRSAESEKFESVE